MGVGEECWRKRNRGMRMRQIGELRQGIGSVEEKHVGRWEKEEKGSWK